MWKEAAQITITCVLAIQMGLVDAISDAIGTEFRILSCPKCLTFWITLGLHLIHSQPFLLSVFVSFVSAYAALWLCLVYDVAATLYNYAYEKINGPDTQETGLPAEDEPGTDEVSELQ